MGLTTNVDIPLKLIGLMTLNLYNILEISNISAITQCHKLRKGPHSISSNLSYQKALSDILKLRKFLWQKIWGSKIHTLGDTLKTFASRYLTPSYLLLVLCNVQA